MFGLERRLDVKSIESRIPEATERAQRVLFFHMVIYCESTVTELIVQLVCRRSAR
jgi:hypothetical protein